MHQSNGPVGERLRVGILLDESNGGDGTGAFSRRPYYALRKDYIRRVAELNALPILVPYEDELIEAFVSLCDCFVIVGGTYKFPKAWYRDAPDTFELDVSARRDFEVDFTKAVLAAKKPVLGICCGMQVLCGVHGSKITYDVHALAHDVAIEHRSSGGPLSRHAVDVIPNTRLASLIGAGRQEVNSAHREAVWDVHAPVRVVARSDDGQIEAIELADHPFAIGVQWHPEIAEPVDQGVLFEVLVEAARTEALVDAPIRDKTGTAIGAMGNVGRP